MVPYCWFCKESVFYGRRTFSILGNVTLEMWDAQSPIWKDYNKLDVEQLLQIEKTVQKRNIIAYVRLSWNRYIRDQYLVSYGLLHFIFLIWISIIPDVKVEKNLLIILLWNNFQRLLLVSGLWHGISWYAQEIKLF